MTIQEYWNSIAPKSGLDEKTLATMGEMFSNPDVAKVLGTHFVTQPDHTAALSTGTEELKALNTKYEQGQAQVNEVKTWRDQQAVPYVKQLEGQLAAYTNLLGPIADPGSQPAQPVAPAPAPVPAPTYNYPVVGGQTGVVPPANGTAYNATAYNPAAYNPVTNPNPQPAPQYITQEHFNNTLQQLSGNFEGLWEDLGYMLTDYTHRIMPHTQKPFDMPAFRAFATEQRAKGLNVKQAYGEFVREDVEAINEKALDDRIKAAETKAVENYASKHDLPTDATPRDTSPVFITRSSEGDPDPVSAQQAFWGDMAEARDSGKGIV